MPRSLGRSCAWRVLAASVVAACGGRPPSTTDRAVVPVAVAPDDDCDRLRGVAWWPGRCSSVDLPLDEPMIADDGGLLALCERADDGAARFRVVDPSNGEEIESLVVKTVLHAARVGVRLRSRTWRPLPRVDLFDDLVGTPVPKRFRYTSLRPSYARGEGLEVIYRMPKLTVEGAGALATREIPPLEEDGYTELWRVWGSADDGVAVVQLTRRAQSADRYHVIPVRGRGPSNVDSSSDQTSRGQSPPRPTPVSDPPMCPDEAPPIAVPRDRIVRDPLARGFSWDAQLCAPKDYAVDEPLLSEDGTRIAICGRKYEEYGRPRELRIFDTRSGRDVYRRRVGSYEEVRAVGEVLATHRWSPLPSLAVAPDPEVVASVPEAMVPFVYRDAMMRAFASDIEVLYREPLLTVRRPDARVLVEQKMLTWGYQNDQRPSDPSLFGYDSCQGVVVSYLHRAWIDPARRFVVVSLASQGGTPPCSSRRLTEHEGRLRFVPLPPSAPVKAARPATFR